MTASTREGEVDPRHASFAGLCHSYVGIGALVAVAFAVAPGLTLRWAALGSIALVCVCLGLGAQAASRMRTGAATVLVGVGTSAVLVGTGFVLGDAHLFVILSAVPAIVIALIAPPRLVMGVLVTNSAMLVALLAACWESLLDYSELELVGSGVVLFVTSGLAARAQRRGNDDAIAQMRRAERLALEERMNAQMLNAQSGLFMADMTYAFRTPLHSVLGYVGLIEETFVESGVPEGSVLYEDIDAIKGAGEQLLGLIDDVVDLSKLEADTIELSLECVEVGAMLEEVASLGKPLALKQGNAFVVENEAEVEQVQADRMRLRQILVNLVSNAAKFTESGTITLRAESDAEWVRLSVRDTGMGMSEHELARVFDAFVQASASTSKTHGGTGLGLALSSSLAEAMGGTLTAMSAPGEGSTFTLSLPR